MIKEEYTSNNGEQHGLSHPVRVELLAPASYTAYDALTTRFPVIIINGLRIDQQTRHNVTRHFFCFLTQVDTDRSANRAISDGDFRSVRPSNPGA